MACNTIECQSGAAGGVAGGGRRRKTRRRKRRKTIKHRKRKRKTRRKRKQKRTRRRKMKGGGVDGNVSAADRGPKWICVEKVVLGDPDADLGWPISCFQIDYSPQIVDPFGHHVSAGYSLLSLWQAMKGEDYDYYDYFAHGAFIFNGRAIGFTFGGIENNLNTATLNLVTAGVPLFDSRAEAFDAMAGNQKLVYVVGMYDDKLQHYLQDYYAGIM